MTRAMIIAPRARAQILNEQLWWLENRPKSPDLFDDELNRAFDLLLAEPYSGKNAKDPQHPNLRRLLLRRTRRHVYYVYDAAHDEILVVALWHAQSGSPPPI